MEIVAYFMLYVATVNAAFFTNQSSLSGDSRHSFNASKPNQVSLNGNVQHMLNSSKSSQVSPKRSNENASSLYDPKDFEYCTKCEIQVPTSSTGELTLCHSKSTGVFTFTTRHQNKPLSRMTFKNPLQEI